MHGCTVVGDALCVDPLCYQHGPIRSHARAESIQGSGTRICAHRRYSDVMTRLGRAASFETIDAEVKEVDGTKIRVATPAALYQMKKGTVRSQDHVDAAALRERFGLKDKG
jgi:hypothetical protein